MTVYNNRTTEEYRTIPAIRAPRIIADFREFFEHEKTARRRQISGITCEKPTMVPALYEFLREIYAAADVWLVR